MDKLVSIVIPCVNEEQNINRTLDALLDLAHKHKYNFEIIAVNDGSKDNTWKVIKEYSNKHSSIKGINFMTNFGQSCGYQAGFDMAMGDYVLTLSADLEIPVENIVKVIELLEQGYDFVNTNRQDRWSHEKASRQKKSGIANKLLARISHVEMKDRGSGLKGMRTEIAKTLKLYGEMHRFIPDLASVYTKNMTEFDVEFTDRDYGESAYKGNKRTVKVLLDLVTLWFLLYFAKKPFYALPGRLFGFTGVVMSFFGFLAGAYLTFVKVILMEPIGGRPLLILATMLIVVGVQFFMFGLVGELLMRTYFESSGRKTYLIKEQA